MLWNPNPDAWRNTYDEWKLASPPEYYAEDQEFHCAECNDTGWQINGADIAEACDACHIPMSLDDLEDLYAEEV